MRKNRKPKPISRYFEKPIPKPIPTFEKPTKKPKTDLQNRYRPSSTQRQTAPSVDVEISFFVSVIRSIGSLSLTGRRCQSHSGSASGTPCSRWHAKALMHGTQQSTSTDGSLTVLHRPESRCWEETGKSSSTKCRPHKTRSKNFD